MVQESHAFSVGVIWALLLHQLKENVLWFWCLGSTGKEACHWRREWGLSEAPEGCLSGVQLGLSRCMASFIKHCGAPAATQVPANRTCGEGLARNTANMGLMSPSRD